MADGSSGARTRKRATRLEANGTAPRLDADGYEYISASDQPDDWLQTVSDAAAFFDRAVLGEQKHLERINSERLQLKFARSIGALPAPLRRCVEVLQSHATASYGDCALQDCYALYTPASETGALARAPQKVRRPRIEHGTFTLPAAA